MDQLGLAFDLADFINTGFSSVSFLKIATRESPSAKAWSRPDKLTNRTDFETILENLILDPALEIKENSIIAVPISISSLTNRINNDLGF